MTKNENHVKAPRRSMGITATRRLSNTFVYILLVVMTVLWLFPFFGILMESFKVDTGGMDGNLFPNEWVLTSTEVESKVRQRL